VPSGEGTSSHQLTMLLSPTTPVIFDSQNFGENPPIRPQGITSILMTHSITPTQVSTIIDLKMEGSYMVDHNFSIKC
jgi:hypothetical protein